MNDITRRLAAVRQRIRDAEARFGRPPGSVRLLAVSKTHPPARVREAYEAGQRAFGENYLQEALAKIEALAGLPLEWHFIGSVQSNKTRSIAGRFDWVQTVDRERIARRLGEHRPRERGPLNVCIEVNVSGEASKAGVTLDALPELAAFVHAQPGLRLRGLMTIPRPVEGLEAQRAELRPLARAWEALRARGYDLDTLSMGMTADLEAAIAEGATLVRVGTAIFGPRAPRAGPARGETPEG